VASGQRAGETGAAQRAGDGEGMGDGEGAVVRQLRRRAPRNVRMAGLPSGTLPIDECFGDLPLIQYEILMVQILLCHRALVDDRPRHAKPITQLTEASSKKSLSKRYVDLSIFGEKPIDPLSLF
jgi:hypothetical protein